MRKTIAFAWLTLLFLVIVGFFWYNDFVYRLPTPIPATYNPIAIGSTVSLPGSKITPGTGAGKMPAKPDKPLFLHFFNPDCPCSRFNMNHVRSLIKEYGTEADFKLVLVSVKDYSPKEIQKRFDVAVPVIKDEDLTLEYGVYSTPQAVIIDRNSQLYYRGNYNRSRYCTDKNTNYAEMALTDLLNDRFTRKFGSLALKAYGCELPGCSKP